MKKPKKLTICCGWEGEKMIYVVKKDGTREKFNVEKIINVVLDASEDIKEAV